MNEFQWEYDEQNKKLTLHTRLDILKTACEEMSYVIEVNKGSYIHSHSIPTINGVFEMSCNKHMIIFSIAQMFNNKSDIEKIKKEVENILELDNNRNLIITDIGVRRL